MTPPPMDRLIGIKYAMPSNPPRSFDCFSLCWFVRALYFGLATPLPYRVESLQHTDIGRVIVEVTHAEIWQEVTPGQFGDIVQLEENHVGVYVDGGVLHAWRSSHHGAVVCTNMRVIPRLFPMCRFLRLHPEWSGIALRPPHVDYHFSSWSKGYIETNASTSPLK